MYQQDPDSMAAVAADRVSRSAARADAAAEKHAAKPAAPLTGEIIQRETPGSAAPEEPGETLEQPEPQADAADLEVPTWRPDGSSRPFDDDWDDPAEFARPRPFDDDWDDPADSTCGESWWTALGLPRWSDLMVFVFGYLLFMVALLFGLNILPGLPL